RNELAVWAAVSGTLLFVAWRMPASFSLIALMSAAVFCLRAFRMPSRPEAAVAAPAPGYRFSASEPALFESVARSSLLTFVPASRDAIGRLLTGALFATYLSAWTTGWSRGPWPEHR